MKKPSMYILITLVLSVAAGAKAASPSKSKYQGQSTQQQTPSRPTETGNRPAEKGATPGKQQQDESRSLAREESNASLRRLSPNRIRSRINEAQRLMKIRPVPT